MGALEPRMELAAPTGESATSYSGWRSDERRFKVFISYSRSDCAAFADELVKVLELEGFAAKLDTRDLEFGEKWQAQLKNFIRQSDAVIYIVSPRSIASNWCRWEIAQVAAQSKRLVPVLRFPVPVEDLPAEIGEIQILPFAADADFSDTTKLLAQALLRDSGWLQEHTRLTELAHTWEKEGQSSDLLLRGQALRNAETWVSAHPRGAPAPSQAQLQFITASQTAAKRRSRYWVAGAATVATLSLMLTVIAYLQQQRAVAERARAIGALVTQSNMIAEEAHKTLEAADPVTAALLALEAVPDTKSPDNIRRDWPYVFEAEQNLYAARIEFREEQVGQPRIGQLLDAMVGTTSILAASIENKDSKDIMISEIGGRSQKQFAGHLLRLRAAAISPSGSHIVTGSADNTARVWNVDTGDSVLLAPHPPDARDQICPERGGSLESTDRQKFRLAQATQPSEFPVESGISRLMITTGCLVGNDRLDVVHVAFSGDGGLALTASEDGTVRLWNTKTGEQLVKFTEHKEYAIAAAFNPSGELVISGGNNGIAWVWRSVDGKELAKLEGHEKYICAAALSADGKKAVTGSADKTVRLWDVAKGALVRTLVGHKEAVCSVAISSDGMLVLSGSHDGEVRLWSFDQDQPLTRLNGHAGPVREVRFTAGDRKILSNGYDSTVRVWSRSSLEQRTELKNPLNLVLSAQISALQPLVVAVSLRDVVHVFDLVTGERLNETWPENYDFRSATISADGTIAAAVSKSGRVVVWNTRSGNAIVSFDSGKWLVDVHLSRDGRYLAARDSDGSVRAWTLPDGQPSIPWLEAPTVDGFIRLKPDGDSLMFNDKVGGLVLKQISGGIRTLASQTEATEIKAAEFDLSGTLVGVGRKDGSVQVVNTVSGVIVKEFKLRAAVERLAFNKQSSQLLVALQDGLVAILDLSTGVWRAYLGTYAHQSHSDVSGIGFHEHAGRAVIVSKESIALSVPVYATTQQLIDEVKPALPRCLTAAQRAKHLLSETVPTWCYEMRKWPYDLHALLRTGVERAAAGDLKKAGYQFKQAEQYNPEAKEFISPIRQKAVVIGAWERARTGDFDASISAITDEMERTQGDKTQLERELAKMHNARAWATLGSTRLEQGLRDADIALRLWPEEPGLVDTRAHILLELKRHDEALAEFSRAIERGADFPGAFVGRGRTHEAKGNIALAIADYRAALQHNSGRSQDWEQIRFARSRLSTLVGGQPN